MNRKISIIIMVVGALLLTSCMSASFSGNYVLKAGKTLRGNLFVTSGSVTLEENSRVTGTILMTSGELHIGQGAQVGGDVVLTSGDVYLADGSIVHGNVVSSNSDNFLHQSPGSKIEGNISTDIAPFIGSVFTQGILLYCILPIVVLIALIIALGTWLGRQSKKRTQLVPAPSVAVSEDIKTELQNLKKMVDENLITETDYEAKKADILAKM